MKFVALGSVAEVIAGQSPEGKFYNAKGDGLPFYQGKKEFGEKFIGEATVWTSRTTKLAKDGDILMSVRAPVGPVNFATQDVCIGRGLAAIRASREIRSDYLFYQLLHLQPEIAGNEGAVFASINKTQIEALPVVAPLLVEQHRIVALLDEAFAGIATAKANAEKNLQNAKEAAESGAQGVLDSAEGAEVALEEAAAKDCSLSYGIVQPGNDVANGLPVVRPVDLTRRVIAPDGLKRIRPGLADGYQRTRLQGGELLLCVRGTTGTIAIASPELAGANVTRGIVPIRFRPELVSPALGYHLMKSAGVQSQIREKTYGAALMQINIGDLRKLSLRIPPLEQQNDLVERLDALEAESSHLQSLYTRKLAALDELKQCLLQQAFSGQL